MKVYSNGKVYATQLLSNGKTTFKITGLPEGTQKISVKYMGSSKYQSSNMISTKKISLISTKVTATYISGTKIKVKVTSNDNTNPNGNVRVYYNGKVYSTQTLNKGQTTFDLLNLPSGTKQITVKYIGSSKYKTSSITVNVKSTQKTTTFTNIKSDQCSYVMLNEYDELDVLYHKGYSGQWGKSNIIVVEANLGDGFRYAKLISARVYYKQGSTYDSKNIPIYADRYYPSGDTSLNDNQTPYKITVTYIPYYYNDY